MLYSLYECSICCTLPPVLPSCPCQQSECNPPPSPLVPQDKPAVPQEVRVLALAWLVLPLGALVTAGVCALTLRGGSSQDAAYVQGVIIHGACTTPSSVVSSSSSYLAHAAPCVLQLHTH